MKSGASKRRLSNNKCGYFGSDEYNKKEMIVELHMKGHKQTENRNENPVLTVHLRVAVLGRRDTVGHLAVYMRH